MSNIISLTGNALPSLLQDMPNPPTELFIQGNTLDEILARPRVAIVGSRKVTAYGKTITQRFAEELAKYGVVIVSGLAFGVDAIAHRSALHVGGLTVAVLPTSLTKIYPSSHATLAKAIVEQGGVLISEYPEGTPSFPGNFVQRNRLVSGISDAVLITEAAENSGTLHTAKFARAQGKRLFAVPGNITSPNSAGTNALIQTGAQLVTSAEEVLRTLGIGKKLQKQKPVSTNPNEQLILDVLYSGICDGNELLLKTQLDVQLFNQTLTMLEITGTVQNLGNNQWSIAQA